MKLRIALLFAVFASIPNRISVTVKVPATAVVFSRTVSLAPYEEKYLSLHPKVEIDFTTSRYRVVAENWETVAASNGGFYYNLHFMRKWRERGEEQGGMK